MALHNALKTSCLILILTISTSEIYKNIPAVMANIQLRTCGSVDTPSPTYKPTIAVRDDRKLNNKARQNERPLVSRMAKSPGDRNQNITVLCIAKHDTSFDCLVNSLTKTDPCPVIQAAPADRCVMHGGAHGLEFEK